MTSKGRSRIMCRFLLALVLFSLVSSPVLAAETTQDKGVLQQPDDKNQQSQQAPASQQSGFRFIVLSDANPSYGTEGLNSKFPDDLKGIPGLNPVFVIHAGDMIGGGNPYSMEKYDKMWVPFFEAIKAITAARIPYLPCPGNHDAGFGVKTAKESYGKNWLANKPSVSTSGNYPYYYSFDYSNNHFIILDSSNIKLGSTQIQWLSDDLANAKNKDNTFVILHIPFMSSGMLHPETADKSALDIISNAGVKYVFAAHNHVYREHDYQNVKQITIGSAADDPRGEKDNMFVVVDVMGKDDVKIYPAGLKSGFKNTIDGQPIPSAPAGSVPSFDPASVIGTNCVPGQNDFSSLLSGEGISYESYPYKGGIFHSMTIDPSRYDVVLINAKKATGKSSATLAEILRNTPGAIAAINGGFFEGGGKPTNSIVVDNELINGVYDKFHTTFVNENGKYKVITLSQLLSYSPEKIRNEVKSAVTALGLVSNGNNVGKSGDRAPRSGVCITKDGLIKFLASNGIQKGSSLVGGYASIGEFAQEAIDRHGCLDGVNLDGGGSTSVEYHINGKDVSLLGERNAALCRGSDQEFPCQRPVGDALVILPKQGMKGPATKSLPNIAGSAPAATITSAFTAVDDITGMAAAQPSSVYSADLSGSLNTITISSPDYLQIRSAYELTGQELATPKTVLDKANEKGGQIVAVTNGAFFGYSNLNGKDRGSTNAGPTCLYIENGRQFFPYEYPDDKKNPDFLCKNRNEFYITNKNEAGILPYGQFESKFSGNNYAEIKYAIQGVNILYDNNIVTEYPKDIEFTFHGGKKERNGICITNDNKIILFVNTDKIGLIDLATKLKNELGCRHAINTDGGATSSMYVKNEDYYFKSFSDDTAQNKVCSTVKSASDFVRQSNGRTQGHGCALNFFLVSESKTAVTGSPLISFAAPTEQIGCICQDSIESSVIAVPSSNTAVSQGQSAVTGAAAETKDKPDIGYDFSGIDRGYQGFGAKKDLSKISKFEPYIQEASQKFGVPAEFIKGVIMTESDGKTKPSSTKAGGKLCDSSGMCLCNSASYCGLMQTGHFSDKCDSSYECNWDNFQKGDEGARDQIFSGTNFIKTLMSDKRLGSPESPDYFYWIAAGYNGGAGSSAMIRESAAERLGIPPERVQWKDVTIEDSKKNQEKNFPTRPGKTEEIFYYASKVMSIVQAAAGGMSQAMQQTIAQKCQYSQVYDYTSIGKYYINPSFTVDVDYNINHYKLISDAVKGLISECSKKDSDDLRECIKEGVDDAGGIDEGNLNLYNGPCDYAENMMSDFAEWTDACLESSSDNCICEIPLEYEYEKENTDEEVTIEASGSGTIQITGAGQTQSLTGSVVGSKKIMTKSGAESHYAKKTGRIIEFVDSSGGAKCRMDKRTYKFCAETKNLYMIYDEKQKKLALMPIQYKFAVDFSEQAAASP
ncbi:hypothetical protein COV19_06550 [Candidatus Woesearchaeota archaeon CG10_big_fil_rev_8_21_14_0_10_44_13]|nr:MAG: hypothetical protein COV19_06550 [Candidatus Woesearchaeota archaeon CG10_big_fil_rev_8_21_14_0_10_44_13]